MPKACEYSRSAMSWVFAFLSLNLSLVQYWLAHFTVKRPETRRRWCRFRASCRIQRACTIAERARPSDQSIPRVRYLCVVSWPQVSSWAKCFTSTPAASHGRGPRLLRPSGNWWLEPENGSSGPPLGEAAPHLNLSEAKHQVSDAKVFFCQLSWKNDRPPRSEGFLFEGVAHFLTGGKKTPNLLG